MGIIDYFKISGPSEKKVPAAAVQKTYKKFAMQSFLAGTLGYSLYYVCRTTLNVENSLSWIADSWMRHRSVS